MTCLDLGFMRSFTLTDTVLLLLRFVTLTVLPRAKVLWVAAVKALLSYFSPFMATALPFILSL